jgi:LPS-assembly lipoprotein
MKRRFLKFLLAVALTGNLAGCGFQLRGQAALPFSAAFVAAPASNVGNGLRRALSSQQKLAATVDAAPVRISLERGSLQQDHSGAVRRRQGARIPAGIPGMAERVANAAGKTVVEPTEIHLSNDFSYSDAQVLAKEAEEASLNRTMEQDALRQIMRRLSYLKL